MSKIFYKTNSFDNIRQKKEHLIFKGSNLLLLFNFPNNKINDY